jgi:hypothetical protein
LRLAVAGAVAALLPLVSPATAAGCDPPTRIAVSPARHEFTLRGGVPRGLRDCYVIAGRAGEVLTIVFQIYAPPWRVRSDADGLVVSGRSLPGAGQSQDARHWRGKLPVRGEYLIVVGAIRGSSAYSLRVTLR